MISYVNAFCILHIFFSLKKKMENSSKGNLVWKFFSVIHANNWTNHMTNVLIEGYIEMLSVGPKASSDMAQYHDRSIAQAHWSINAQQVKRNILSNQSEFPSQSWCNFIGVWDIPWIVLSACKLQWPKLHLIKTFR